VVHRDLQNLTKGRDNVQRLFDFNLLFFFNLNVRDDLFVFKITKMFDKERGMERMNIKSSTSKRRERSNEQNTRTQKKIHHNVEPNRSGICNTFFIRKENCGYKE
jgi:hypothetical protein